MAEPQADERATKSQRKSPSTGFPSFPLDEAAVIVRTAGAYGIEHQVAALAQYMGHTTHNSGAFKAKLASLRDFGLVVGRGDPLSLSDTAQSIAHPESDEAAHEALKDSFFRSDVFARVHESLAKGVELGVDGIGNAAVRNFGVAATSKQSFVDSFVASAVEAGVAQRIDDRRVRILPRTAVPAPPTGTGNTASIEPAAGAPVAPQTPPPEPTVRPPTTLHQQWEADGSELTFEIRSRRPLPASTFAQIAKVIEESERLADLLSVGPPDIGRSVDGAEVSE